MENYLKQLEKALKVEPKIKEKIISDMRSDFEMYIAAGDTIEQIIGKIGSPEDVANDFNQNYPEYRQNKKKRKLGIFTIICTAVSAIFLSIGLIGRFVYLGGNYVSHIGGADLPTDIVVTSAPISALTIYDGLIKIAIGLLVVGFVCACYFFIKYKRKH